MQTEKFSATAEKGGHMSPDAVARDCQGMLRQMGAALAPSAGQKERFHQMARHIGGLTDGQVKRLFYGEWAVIPAHVFLAVRNAYRQHLERAARRADHDAAVFRVLQAEWDNRWDDFSSCGSASSVPDEKRAAFSDAR